MKFIRHPYLLLLLFLLVEEKTRQDQKLSSVSEEKLQNIAVFPRACKQCCRRVVMLPKEVGRGVKNRRGPNIPRVKYPEFKMLLLRDVLRVVIDI